EDGGVLVEGDVGAVVAPELLLGADDDGGHDLALLDGAVGDRLLDGADDDVADAGVATAGAAADADAEDLAGAGVVGDAEACLGLDHLSGPFPRSRRAASAWCARAAGSRSLGPCRPRRPHSARRGRGGSSTHERSSCTP